MTSFKTIETNNTDKNLVGIWKGFEINKQIDGVEKHWIIQRFKNGTYVIMFTTKQDCEISTFTEKGKWWTKGDIFYEQYENSNITESYKYKITDGLVVHFKSQTIDYEFEDYRLE